MIDSSDRDRMDTSRSELLTMLSEEELNGVPLLVFCNKQDIEGALRPEEISEKLGLVGEKGREWSVRGSCATKGEGLEDGLDWCVFDHIDWKSADRMYQACQRNSEEVGLRVPLVFATYLSRDAFLFAITYPVCTSHYNRCFTHTTGEHSV